jgi:hypothetical protein
VQGLAPAIHRGHAAIQVRPVTLYSRKRKTCRLSDAYPFLVCGLRLPLREQRGPVPPNPGHRDAILDLKALELQPSQGGRVMLSCSRDHTIKLWK